MNLYIVRITENKEILGFFFAHDLDDLYWTIDEFVNPSECEYYEVVERFSMVWDTGGTPVHPRGDPESSDYEDWNFDRMSFCENSFTLLGSIENDTLEFVHMFP